MVKPSMYDQHAFQRSFRHATGQLLQWLATVTVLLFVASPVVAASLIATVDRTIISEYETLELTLRTDKSTDETPDLSILEPDFEIVTTRQNRQIRIINGQTESWLDWIVTLSPKREGRLTIPALHLGNLTSAPITVQVQKNTNTAGGNVSPVFMRSEVDNEFVYVQQQVVLTLRVFYRVNLYDDSRLSPLEIDGAIVQQLGDTRKYDTVIDGKRYGVFELKFAIYPQKTGMMTIPELVFNGVMAERSDPFGSMFSMSGGKPIVARSPEIRLNVQPQPDDYSGRQWLPAQNLTLTESWSQSLDEIRVGDAVTRTITVEADGLTSAQLPAVPKPHLQNVNVYPDQSKTEDTPTDTGIIGRRQDAIAIIPTQPGKLHLPAIRTHWFDTEANLEKVAELPARTITVLPSTTASIPTEPAAPVVEPQVTQAPVESPPVPEPVVVEGSNSVNVLWQALTALFALLWLVTLGIWFRSRQRHIPLVTDTLPDRQTGHSETSAFKMLAEGCHQGNVNEIKLAFVEWCQARLNDTTLTTTGQCLNRLKSDNLNSLFQQMDAALYSNDKSTAPFMDILKQCEQLRKNVQKTNTDKKEDLPGLYPS